jgi:hypothetical protein
MYHRLTFGAQLFSSTIGFRVTLIEQASYYTLHVSVSGSPNFPRHPGLGLGPPHARRSSYLADCAFRLSGKLRLTAGHNSV